MTDNLGCVLCDRQKMQAEIERLRAGRRRLLGAVEDHFDGGEGMWLHADVAGTERVLRDEYEQQLRVDLAVKPQDAAEAAGKK